MIWSVQQVGQAIQPQTPFLPVPKHVITLIMVKEDGNAAEGGQRFGNEVGRNQVAMHQVKSPPLQ